VKDGSCRQSEVLLHDDQVRVEVGERVSPTYSGTAIVRLVHHEDGDPASRALPALARMAVDHQVRVDPASRDLG
jgi:hypothetical protein